MIRIKTIAKEKGIKVAELATMVGVTREMCSRQINSTNITISTAQKYADALNVPLWQLFTEPATQGASIMVCPHCGKPIQVHITAQNCTQSTWQVSKRNTLQFTHIKPIKATESK